MAFDFPSVATKKRKEKEKKAKAKKNIETKSGDMVQPDPDILGKRFDKKFRKYALSKESQLHAKDFDDGIDKGEARAINEVMQEAAIKKPKFSKGGGMSSGQAAIAAKAPPPNVLNGKDLAVLRAEKAKGRGMGLQDESVQPGKVQKAALGVLAMKKANEKGAKGPELLSPVMLAKRLFNKKSGGVMKYKRGSGLDLPVINSVKPTVNKTKRAQNLSRMKIQFTKQKNRAGAYAKKMGLPKPLVTSEKFKNVGKFPYVSMAEMRKAKGFKPGESATDFNKRRKMLAGVTKAASATKIGKIALGIGAIGLGAKKYLESKMKKKEVKKKMSGGSIKKYSEGMSYKDMAPYGGKYAKIKKDMRDTASENVKRLTTQSDAYDPETRYVTASQRRRDGGGRRRTIKTTDQVYLKGVANKMKQDMGRGTSTSILTPSQARDRRIIKPERRRALSTSSRSNSRDFVKDRQEKLDRRPPRKSFNMGGMMMQKPMGYKHGTSVTAKCKLGRNKATKIT